MFSPQKYAWLDSSRSYWKNMLLHERVTLTWPQMTGGKDVVDVVIQQGELLNYKNKSFVPLDQLKGHSSLVIGISFWTGMMKMGWPVVNMQHSLIRRSLAQV